jgi:hypothetical protein
MGGNSIHFFLWDTAVASTGYPDPAEQWYFDEKPNSVGHAVTGVGFLLGWDIDEGGPLPMMDWIICHDNWPTTPENVAVPWVDSLWIATFTADPGPDTIHPSITCRDTAVYLDGTGQFHLDESYVVESAWDNNGVEQLFLDEYYVSCLHTETPKTVTATAMDMFGNMAKCTAQVTVRDTIPPLPLCKDTTIYLDAAGNAGIDSSYINSGSSDNCNLSRIHISQSSFDCTDVGVNPVNVTLSDVNGNTSQCQVLVRVIDSIKPLALCTDTTVYLGTEGKVSIDSCYVNQGSFDNCGIRSVMLSEYDFTCGDIGSNDITVRIQDVNGNTRECNSRVWVLDSIRPTLTCTDTIIYLDSTGSFTIDAGFVMENVGDNCEVADVVLSRSVFTTDDLASPQQVSLTACDESGNSSICEVQITVMDTTASAVNKRSASGAGLELRIYPNPTNGILTIESKIPLHDGLLEIYSTKGVLLLKGKIHRERVDLDLSDFSKGIYVLKVKEPGGMVYRSMILIK